MRRAGIGALLLAVMLSPLPVQADAEPPPPSPYEEGTGFVPVNAIDMCSMTAWARAGVQPAPRCSDAVFLRRVTVDLTGTLPAPSEVWRFLADPDPEKRTALVDRLLDSDAFTDYWTCKWCDLLRVKSEFPIRLWPNGVQAYARWIHDAVRENQSLDAFARALLTASGSNYREPAVNFYRAVQDRSAEGLAGAAALTFLGMRIERWPADRRQAFARFFSRVRYKPTAEWKEEIVLHDPAPGAAFDATLPDGQVMRLPSDQDPRIVFADWLLAPGNAWFARNLANRVWSWLWGRGILDPADDLPAPGSKPRSALLGCLERQLVGSGYDLRALMRLIVRSRTYQASPIPRSADPQAQTLFASYPTRRLDAEVLLEALCRIDGRGERYESRVPEPFTILPGVRRAETLADGTITSSFLEMFGRPARDTGLEAERSHEPTSAQRLYLLNSSDVNGRLARSPWLRGLMRRSRREPKRFVTGLYMWILSRPPTAGERATFRAYVETPGQKLRDAALDLAWALINSKEFLYRH